MRPRSTSGSIWLARLALVLGLTSWSVGFWAWVTRSPKALADADEYFAATQAILAAQGVPLNLISWQILPSCGGCAVETFEAMSLFTFFPPTLLVWKLVPLGFGLVLVALGWRFGWLLGGPLCASLVAGTLGLAPSAVIGLGAHGYGNHFEVCVILIATLLAVERASRVGGAAAWGWVGLLAGFAVFFSHTSAPVLVGMAAGWFVGGGRGNRRQLFPLLAGFAVGGLPWLFMRSLPFLEGAAVFQVYQGRPLLVDADRGAWLAALFGEAMQRTQFHPGLEAWPGVALGAGVVAQWAAVLGCGLVAVQARRQGVLGRRTLGVLAAGVVAHAAAWLAIAPGMPAALPFPGDTPYAFRYFVPGMVLMAVAAGLLPAGARGWHRVLRVAPAAVLITLGGANLLETVRASQWSPRSLTMSSMGPDLGAQVPLELLPQLALPPPPGDPSDLFGLGPLAIRPALYTLGRSLGWEWTTGHSADPSWFDWLDTLDDAGLAAMMGGVSSALAEVTSGGPDPQDAWQSRGDAERLAGQLSLEAGSALARAEVRRRPLGNSGEDAVLGSLQVITSESSTEFARRQASVGLGKLGWAHCYVKEAAPTCLAVFLGRVPLVWQSEVARSFGEELGRAEGHLSGAAGPWEDALPREPASALGRGFTFQSSWTFVR
jgi:hypothetical protein